MPREISMFVSKKKPNDSMMSQSSTFLIVLAHEQLPMLTERLTYKFQQPFKF